MCVAIVGGMDRLERHYREEAVRLGIDMRVFSRSETNLTAKLRRVDAMVIFTNKVSHRARNEAMKAARAGAIPVLMCHSCGVCTLRECLDCLVSADKGGTCDDEASCRDTVAGIALGGECRSRGAQGG